MTKTLAFYLLFLISMDSFCQNEVSGVRVSNVVVNNPKIPSHPLTQSDNIVAVPHIRIRCASTVSNSNPLWVVDGFVLPTKDVETLDPADITSIEVLKDATATAVYGSAGINGVIMINTKTGVTKNFIIADFTDGNSLAMTSLRFISADTKDTLTMTTDKNGQLNTSRLKINGDYQILLTHVGYKPLTVIYRHQNIHEQSRFLLERNEIFCEEVVLQSSVCLRRKIACGYSINYKNEVNSNQTVTAIIPNTFNLYPNPVKRGQAFSMSYSVNINEPVTVKLFNTSGSLAFTKSIKGEKNHTEQVAIDARWSAGIYFLQMTDSRGKLIEQKQILVN